MLIIIPFSGFYGSIHESQFDNELYHSIFTDYKTGCNNNNDNLTNRAFDVIQWRELYNDYARDYTEFFAHEFNIILEFESLHSPREYNFATDRIFCTISESEVIRLFNETTKLTLMNTAKSMFTSRDGFWSFYDPNWMAWDNVLTWDHNQLNCLLIAWLSDNTDFNDELEWRYIEYASSNGFYYELIEKYCTDKRIFTVHAYLNARAERV